MTLLLCSSESSIPHFEHKQAQKTPLLYFVATTIVRHRHTIMADQIAQAIPERPKDTPADEAGAVAPAEGEKGPSKGALKKAAKEKEKVRYGFASPRRTSH
jgi:hypothetical protein